MIDLRNHYGFTRTPFGKDLAPSMLCHYPAHAEAVARITWCARERALGVVTGEVGSGKTASARAAVAALDQTRHTLIYLADPTTGTRGIHYQVVTALGGRPAHGSATLAAQAAALLAAEHNERGRVPVLAIDEAHLLTHDQLEAVRILTNSEMDAASPLACLLIGQPTLRRMLRLGVLAALDQRIAIRYAMPAMTAEQTAGYITHHLKLAGRSDPLFSERRRHLDPRRRPRPAPRRQQPRHPGPGRRHGRAQEHRRRAKRPRRRHRSHDRLTTTAPARTPRPRQHPAGGAVDCPHVLIVNDRYIVILSDREHRAGPGGGGLIWGHRPGTGLEVAWLSRRFFGSAEGSMAGQMAPKQ